MARAMLDSEEKQQQVWGSLQLWLRFWPWYQIKARVGVVAAAYPVATLYSQMRWGAFPHRINDEKKKKLCWFQVNIVIGDLCLGRGWRAWCYLEGAVVTSGCCYHQHDCVASMIVFFFPDPLTSPPFPLNEHLDHLLWSPWLSYTHDTVTWGIWLVYWKKVQRKNTLQEYIIIKHKRQATGKSLRAITAALGVWVSSESLGVSRNKLLKWISI